MRMLIFYNPDEAADYMAVIRALLPLYPENHIKIAANPPLPDGRQKAVVNVKTAAFIRNEGRIYSAINKRKSQPGNRL